MSLNAAITSLAFLGVLWSITPWLVLVALVYAAVGSAMTILLGRPLVGLDNLQLQKEADLRYHLIQTRETAEAIATMRAARPVRDCLRSRPRRRGRQQPSGSSRSPATSASSPTATTT